MIELRVLPQKRALTLEQEPPAPLVDFLKVVAEPNRLRILALLNAGETCVCEMVDALGLPQNALSHHLGVLKRAGLLRERRDGRDARWIYYMIDREALARANAVYASFFDSTRIAERAPDCDGSGQSEGE